MGLGQQGTPGRSRETKVMVSCRPQPPGTHPAHTGTRAGSAGAASQAAVSSHLAGPWGSCREARGSGKPAGVLGGRWSGRPVHTALRSQTPPPRDGLSAEPPGADAGAGPAPGAGRTVRSALPRGRGRAGSFNYRWLGPLSRANPGPRLRAARAGAPSPPARARGPRVLTSCRPQLKRARRGCRCANELRGRWAARQGGAGAGWGRGWLGWGDLGPFPGRGPGLPECAHLRRGVPHATPTSPPLRGLPECAHQRRGFPHPALRSQDSPSVGQGLGSKGQMRVVLGPVVCPGRPLPMLPVTGTWASDADNGDTPSGTWLGSAASWGLNAGAP